MSDTRYRVHLHPQGNFRWCLVVADHHMAAPSWRRAVDVAHDLADQPRRWQELRGELGMALRASRLKSD